jgi:MoaA/NifB/PqqE/SkfB family radical SAM enzyme
MMGHDRKPGHAKWTPENLSLELTTRCNSRCTHCFARAGLVQEKSLSPELAGAICAEGYAAGYRHLHLTGGEPLLWPHLLDLLDAVFERGYQSVFLNTNGLLLTEPVVRRLARYPDLAVSVSLQGPPALHDRVRGAGAYRRTTRGISWALDAGLTITLFAATGKSLLDGLPTFAADVHAQFHGIERLTLIQLIRVPGDVFDLSPELLDPEDFIRLVGTVSALNLCGLATDVLHNPLVNVVAAKLHLPLVPHSHPLCRKDKLIVRANRDMTLAHSSRDSFGRYERGMIAALRSDDRLREALAPDRTLCPTCRFVDLCRRNGMMRPSVPAVDMPADVPYCQRVLARIEHPRCDA